MYSLDQTGTELTIDLKALAANWQTIAAHVAPAACAAVIKADAYGAGLEQAAKALWNQGARQFFVAHTGEGIRARQALPEAAIIFVLNGLPASTAPLFLAHNLVPVLGSIAEVREWTEASSSPYALHIDTGMNRLGVTLQEAQELADQNVQPALVMSHLACADTPKHPHNALQLARFTQARALFPKAQASLANSAASLGNADYHFDLCRPGIALYGGAASTATPALKPVAALKSRVIQVRSVKAGEAIGYGAAHALPHDATLAILSAGYADGILRSMGASSQHQGGYASFEGILCPIIGRISMDLIAVDITTQPLIQRGDWMHLLGDAVNLDDAARAAGTISYELLTSLSRRAHRVYITDL